MKRVTFAALVAALVIAGANIGGAATSDSMLERQLIAQIQARLDAYATGDKRPWQEDLDANALLMDEEGVITTKAEFLAQLRPLPSGSSGTLRVTQPRFSRAGDVAVVAFVADEHEMIYQAHFAARYGMVDTYRRKGNRWLLMSDTQTRLAHDPPTASLPESQLRHYVGRYRMDGGPYEFVVMIQGANLVGGREGRSPRVLHAIADQPNMFFQDGSPATFIFVPGPGGIAAKLIDRRYYNRDLTHTRF